jgi:hypothetical protein
MQVKEGKIMDTVLLHISETDGLTSPLYIVYPDEDIVYFSKETGKLDMSKTKEYIGSPVQVISDGKLKFASTIKDYSVIEGIGRIHFNEEEGNDHGKEMQT